jgi:hypothetical protein
MSNGGFHSDLTPFLQMVLELLMETAAQGRTITYEGLSALVEERTGKPYPHYRWGSMLGRLSHWERAHGRPLISAIVVNRDGTVGPGFWKMVEDEMGIPVLDRDGFQMETQQSVFRYWAT